MSNSLVLILASNHYGALASLIGPLHSLNCENVTGKSNAVIRSVSSLSVASTLSTVRIGFVVSEWYDFHRNIFPSAFSVSICNIVDCGIILVCMLLHGIVSRS